MTGPVRNSGGSGEHQRRSGHEARHQRGEEETAAPATGDAGRPRRYGCGGRIDVVISNCVINLSTDKAAVFAEMFRVLASGGRIGISDVVADDRLTPDQRAERGDYVGCIAGALSFTEYREGLAAAGFTDTDLTPTHAVADGMHSATVRATKPTTAADTTARPPPGRRAPPPAAAEAAARGGAPRQPRKWWTSSALRWRPGRDG